jgi:hypothetical protein
LFLAALKLHQNGKKKKRSRTKDSKQQLHLELLDSLISGILLADCLERLQDVIDGIKPQAREEFKALRLDLLTQMQTFLE